MTDAEVGIYVFALCAQWRNGSIPVDPSAAARELGRPVRGVRAAWPVVSECFEVDPSNPSRMLNRRQECERLNAIEKSRSASESAKRRYERSANALRTQQDTRARSDQEQESDSFSVPRSVDVKRNSTHHTSSVCARANSQFAQFWARYRKLRDAGRENITAQMWLAFGCDEHAEQVFACLTSYEQSRDASNGAVFNGEQWLRVVKESGYQARWPPRILPSNGNGRKSWQEEMLEKI